MFEARDDRGAPRQKTLKGARIVFNEGRSTIDCTIRNLSPGGAKLLVTSVVGVPNSFDLVMANGERRACRVAWRALKELGVAFEAR